MMTERKEQALVSLAREVRGLFHQLRAAVDAIHGDKEPFTTAHRAVLESLHRGGPRTVPALARSRPVARQHIQVLVNRLLELGLVAVRPNPAHRRSPMIELTPAGRKRFEAMLKREHQALSALDLPVSETALREAARTLESVRDALKTAFTPAGELDSERVD